MRLVERDISQSGDSIFSSSHPVPAEGRIVEWVPVFSLVLLQGANVAQMYEMWRASSAAGQSLGGYLMVTVALAGWYWYHRVITPGQWKAQAATLAGVLVNLLVVGTVAYFQYRPLG